MGLFSLYHGLAGVVAQHADRTGDGLQGHLLAQQAIAPLEL
jgi:hypothetical protein